VAFGTGGFINKKSAQTKHKIKEQISFPYDLYI
jgi:hypothetical protein